MTATDAPAGRHERLQQIGQGERAAVFHGRDLQRGQPVVIKRFTPGRASSPALTRMAAVVDTLRRASPRGVVLPLALTTTGSEPQAIYPALAGTTLDRLMLAGFVPSWSGAADIVGRCAEILAAVGQATGLSHRALKPGNIWLAPNGEVSLLDFGIAELGVCAAPPRDGPVYVEYRAPEQLDGAAGDARSDVFALAVLLCELSTGVHPFAGSSAFQVARQLLIWGAPSTALVTRGMTAAGAREAETLLSRCLTREPAGRFADAQEFSQALQFARRVIGTPAVQSAAPAAPVRAPARPIAAVEDPTTMMQVPGPRGRERAPTPAPTPAPRPAIADAAIEAPTLQVLAPRYPVAPEPPAGPATILAVAPSLPALLPPEERTAALPSPGPTRSPRPLAAVHDRSQTGPRRISAPEELQTVEFSRMTAPLASRAGPTPVAGPRATESSDDMPTGAHIVRAAAALPPVEPTLELPRDPGPARAPVRDESTAIAPMPTSSLDRSHKVLLALNVLCVALVLCGLVLMVLL